MSLVLLWWFAVVIHQRILHCAFLGFSGPLCLRYSRVTQKRCSDVHVLHRESNKGNKGLATKAWHDDTIKITNHQATTKQPTNNTINLCTNHPTHHTHQPALHPHEHKPQRTGTVSRKGPTLMRCACAMTQVSYDAHVPWAASPRRMCIAMQNTRVHLTNGYIHSMLKKALGHAMEPTDDSLYEQRGTSLRMYA